MGQEPSIWNRTKIPLVKEKKIILIMTVVQLFDLAHVTFYLWDAILKCFASVMGFHLFAGSH